MEKTLSTSCIDTSSHKVKRREWVKMVYMKRLKEYWENQLIRNERITAETNWIWRKILAHEKRGASVVRVIAEGVPYRSLRSQGEQYNVEYMLYVTFLIKQGSRFYIEEEQKHHRAHFLEGEIVSDRVLPILKDQEVKSASLDFREEEEDEKREDRFTYDRHKAVQYANRWWNSYNPAYKEFQDDCTNFISQCLRAGNAPMWGSPNRSKGWWFSGSNWSYSWTVANSMRWYLSGAKQGIKGTQMERASDLLPGDIICYDFEGDGRWNHTTIVVDKDANGQPLVNAHSSNSFQRYWDYEDSTAYTPNIKYIFFRIGE